MSPPPHKSAQQKKKAEPETIFQLQKYLNAKISVKFSGGREVKGILKGYDNPCNLVLDAAEEFVRDPEDNTKILPDKTRKLGGLCVCRGTSISVIGPGNVIQIGEDDIMGA